MRYKYLIISFLAFLPFWWAINLLSGQIEGFWFIEELSLNASLLNSRIDENVIQLKKIRGEKALIGKLQNLEIQADAVNVVRIDENWNSKILFENNSEEIHAIASLTKLMTALVVFLDETYKLQDNIVISQKAVDQLGVSSLKAGDSLTIKALLEKMLIESSNDSAFALADLIGEKSFVDLMVIYSNKLGLNNTYFINPTGLDPDHAGLPKNFSTAEDLAVLSKYILQNYPIIFEITKTELPENTNELLREYPEIIGGKTGWTPLAKGCLLAVSRQGNEYYISVILGADDRFGQMRKILNVLN